MAGMLAAYHPHDCSGNQLGSGPRIAMSLTTTSTSSTTPTTSPPQLEYHLSNVMKTNGLP